jgi:hypothetical protein
MRVFNKPNGGQKFVVSHANNDKAYFIVADNYTSYSQQTVTFPGISNLNKTVMESNGTEIVAVSAGSTTATKPITKLTL